jgi:hypothetical protein
MIFHDICLRQSNRRGRCRHARYRDTNPVRISGYGYPGFARCPGRHGNPLRRCRLSAQSSSLMMCCRSPSPKARTHHLTKEHRMVSLVRDRKIGIIRVCIFDSLKNERIVPFHAPLCFGRCQASPRLIPSVS